MRSGPLHILLSRANLRRAHSFARLGHPPNGETIRMRINSIVLVVAATMVIGIAGQRPALADQYRGTFEQRMACMSDVWRLCSDDIPDTNRIVACLRENTL